MKKTKQLNQVAYFVQGMHCASCEILIEKKLLKQKGVTSAEASTGKNTVTITYDGKKPSLNKLNQLFAQNNYTFSNQAVKIEKDTPLFRINQETELEINKEKFGQFIIVAGSALILIIGFILLNKSELSAYISVNSKSSLPMFFFFGLLAGVSSCMALVGGVILSMAKQWSQLYPNQKSTLAKLQPHFLFNMGRIASYTILGGILGFLGQRLQISLTFTSVLTIAISIMMLFLALQMLGVQAFQRFKFGTPKFLTRFITDESNFNGRLTPLIMGALTFFLPCGFTITAQGLALTSGSPIQAGLIMLFFALGTTPALLAIGISSIEFYKRPHFSELFLKVAGILVLFFALYNVNSQLNVLGFKSLNDFDWGFGKSNQSEDIVSLVDGKQVIKMTASASSYTPNWFTVQAGIPVRWEIYDAGTSGCTNAVISKSLFDGEIELNHGKTSVKEFTPEKPGIYKFSCWMGMVSGTIEVTNGESSLPTANINIETSSGAQGCDGSCGGGCGGGCSGGCGSN